MGIGKRWAAWEAVCCPGQAYHCFANHRWAMDGNRLARRANSWSTENSTAIAAAGSGRTVVRQRRATPTPDRQAAPVTRVMAISTGEKWPDTMCDCPVRNSQISTMIPSQKIRQGSADHLASSLLRNPALWQNLWVKWPWMAVRARGPLRPPEYE